MRRRKLAWYENGYHMLLRDLQAPVVIADVARWVLTPAAHCLPVPTGPLPKPFCRPTAAYHWPAADPVHLWSILQLLVLLMLANGTPVVAKKFLGERFTYPLDGGVVFVDGRPSLAGRRRSVGWCSRCW
jgi:hypothetical protein